MPPRRVSFGVFEADLEVAELRKSGMLIRLQEQPFQVLAALLERPGEVVTREELQRRLWPDDTFVDFEHSLNVAINKLREALSDSASTPRYIETVPRRGYRFVGSIAGRGSQEALPSAEPPTAIDRTPKRRWWIAAMLMVGVAAGLGAAAAIYWGRAPSVMIAAPLTGDPGQEQEPSLSPDGAHVAYAADPDGQLRYDIYVRTIGSGQARRLTATRTHERNPAWSPDGRLIAFVRWDGKVTAQLILIPAMGGAERVLATAEMHAATFSEVARLLAWFPDGKRLVHVETRDGRSSLSVLLVETGEKRALLTPPSGTFDRDPGVSGDGRYLAFARARTGSADLMVVQLNADGSPAGETRPLIRDGRLNSTPVWLPNRDEILFSSGARHFRQLYRVSASGGQPVQLPVTGGFHTIWPSVSGTRLVYHTGHYDVNVWRTPLKHSVAAGPAERIAYSTYIDHYPCLSPDGRRLAFVSNRSGFQELWVGGPRGENALQLTDFRGREVNDPVWLPAGDRIGFGAGGDSYSVDGAGGVPVLLRRGGGSYSWSGDGRWIFAPNRANASRISRIAVRDGRAEGPPFELSQKGGARPRESPDRRWIYFSRGAQSASLWRIPSAGGSVEQLVAEEVSTNGNWTVTQEGVWFIPMAGEDGRTSIQLLDPETGRKRMVAPVDRVPMWGLTICPQAACAIHSQADRFESDLMVVENFR